MSWLAVVICFNNTQFFGDCIEARAYLQSEKECQQRLEEWPVPHIAVPELDYIRRCVPGPELGQRAAEWAYPPQ